MTASTPLASAPVPSPGASGGALARARDSLVRWAFPAVPVRRLVILRTVLSLFVVWDMWRLATDPLPHGDVPADLYRPILLRRLLSLPAPSPHYVQVLAVVLTVSALATAAGLWPRASGAVCALALLDWLSNDFSYSKIDHDQFALTVALLVLPASGRLGWRDRGTSEAAGWVLRTVQVAVVCCYFLAACAKMRFGGWGWANGAVFTWAFTRRGTALAHTLADIPGFVRVSQWGVLLAEFASPVMLVLRGRPLFAAVTFWGLFHLLTWRLVGIHFLPLVVCLLAFLPLERLAPGSRAPEPAPSD